MSSINFIVMNPLQEKLAAIEDVLQSPDTYSLNARIQELMKKVPLNVRNEINFTYWDKSGKPSSPNYSENHAADKPELFAQIIAEQMEKEEAKKSIPPKKEESKRPEVEPAKMPDFEFTPLQQSFYDIEKTIKEDPKDTLNRRLGNLLRAIPDQGVRDRITFKVWENGGKQSIADYGFNHAADDLPFFEKLIDQEFRNDLI